MRLVLLAVGRMKQGPERELMTRYVDRTRVMVRAIGLTGFDNREIDESRARHPAERKRDEARALEAQLAAGARLVVLDERGRSVTSPVFAGIVGAARDSGVPEFALVVGGPDGLADSLRERAHLVLAFGAATFPHQIVRVLAAEQLYRAATLLAGHPYHRT